MDFELTPDQRAIQTLARELAEAEIVPNASAWDRDHRFPDELYPKLGLLQEALAAVAKSSAKLETDERLVEGQFAVIEQ